MSTKWSGKNMTDLQLIEGCKKHDRIAQKILFEKYSRFLLGICLRYASDKAEAEDILQDCFVKIFFHIGDFSGTGSFSGWLRRIAVNTSITSYHKNMKYRYQMNIDDYSTVETGTAGYNDSQFTSEELLRILNELPPGYRMVFNLYAIEGYKHKEIAELMSIDINTSKSQYSRARALIRSRLEELEKIKDRYTE